MASKTISTSSWNTRTARHLLNRAGFGIPTNAVEKLAGAGPEQSVALMVDYESYPADWSPPEFLTPRGEARQAYAMTMQMDDEARRMSRQQMQRDARREMEQLKSWWLGKMRSTKRPLEEKMALFWHGHFATSAQDVKLPVANWELNQIFREHATGNFRTLVFEVGKSHAMMEYLDNRRNRKDSPNENWARELLELFTLGIGSYTETDIKEAARAFTGYTNQNGTFVFQPNQHDYGEKTFLGKKGTFDGADIVNIIFEQPQCARFITRKLLSYFVIESPSDAMVEKFASTLRDNDYELKPLLRAIFLSEEFYAPESMAGQIKSPAQFMVMLMEQLQLSSNLDRMVTQGMRSMDQDLFYPPNVKGWDGNRAWINSNTLLVRYNIPGYLFTGEQPQQITQLELDQVERERSSEENERREKARNRLNNMPKERVKQIIAKRLGLDLYKLMAPLDGLTAQQAVARMEETFLVRPLADDQRWHLVRAFGKDVKESTRLDIKTMKFDDLAAPLHLVMATAEYQLC